MHKRATYLCNGPLRLRSYLKLLSCLRAQDCDELEQNTDEHVIGVDVSTMHLRSDLRRWWNRELLHWALSRRSRPLAHGAGYTRVAQVNDTDLHARLRNIRDRLLDEYFDQYFCVDQVPVHR